MAVKDILSVQLYSLRSLPSRTAMFETVADAGYGFVEMTGNYLAEPEAVCADLKAHGLKGSSSHVSMAQLREGPEAIIGACKVLEISELYMPAVPAEERDMDASGWRALGLELSQFADKFTQAGIRLGYHNHDWELAQKEDGKTALDILFEAAGSSPLTWQADIAWLARGGADPKLFLERYAKRLACTHVKDIAPKGQNLDEDGWADIGSGILDWPDLWQTSRDLGAGWMIAEHDKPSDPAAWLRNSWAFLNAMKV